MTDTSDAEALNMAQEENRALNRIIEVFSSGIDLERVLTAAVDLVLETTGVDACFLHLYEPDNGGRLVLRAASEPYRKVVGTVTLALGEGVSGWVAEHREPVVIAYNKWADIRYKYIPALGGDRHTSMLSVPLVSPADRLIGVVNLHTEEHRAFGQRDIDLLSHVASLLATAIEHASLFRELEDKEEALQRMVKRTVAAQEEERRRVATEIHDGVTQQLISIWYRVQACERLLERDLPAARGELEEAKSLIGEALNEARSAIYDLRPATLDDLGLVPAIEALTRRTFGPEVEVNVATDIPPHLPMHLETALYRICQELLNNVRKHAGAARVEINLESGRDQIRMIVIDDGKGFDVGAYRNLRPETSFGLAGVTERVEMVGGRLELTSEEGKGTRAEIRIPFERSPEAPLKAPDQIRASEGVA
ncbi:MAG TPA: GAF domain-containing sensor histidine kinase [Actinomycetota bacterium]|nr:GAF domain-containing sensor histidine kinase [Actinomycetota bacterium]